MSALEKQVGGNHYKGLAIQPVEYAMANKLDGCQFEAIKYITRFRDKNGIQDLEKAKHFIDILIEFEGRKAKTAMAADVLGDTVQSVVLPDLAAMSTEYAQAVENSKKGQQTKRQPPFKSLADLMGSFQRPAADKSKAKNPDEECQCSGCTMSRLMASAQTKNLSLDDIEAMFPGLNIVIVTPSADDEQT